MIILNPIKVWKGIKVIIYAPSWIHDSVTLGEATKIGAFNNIDAKVIIGKGNNIQTMCTMSEGTQIGNGNFIGPDCHFYNDKYMNSVLGPPIIGNHNRLGGSNIIMPGVVIGDNSFICAGAMITKDVPSGTQILPERGKKERVVW